MKHYRNKVDLTLNLFLHILLICHQHNLFFFYLFTHTHTHKGTTGLTRPSEMNSYCWTLLVSCSIWLLDFISSLAKLQYQSSFLNTERRTHTQLRLPMLPHYSDLSGFCMFLEQRAAWGHVTCLWTWLSGRDITKDHQPASGHHGCTSDTFIHLHYTHLRYQNQDISVVIRQSLIRFQSKKAPESDKNPPDIWNMRGKIPRSEFLCHYLLSNMSYKQNKGSSH